MYTSRAFQNGIDSQNILIFVGTSSVDAKKYILEKCKKKKKKIASFIAFLQVHGSYKNCYNQGAQQKFNFVQDCNQIFISFC